MKEEKKKSLVWLILVVLLVNLLAPFSDTYAAYATEQESMTQTILDDSELTIKVKADVIDEGISWELQYENKLINAEDSQRLKLELTADGQQVSFPQTTGWSSIENWFAQDEFYQHSEGTIQVITDHSVQNLSLRIQADSETTGKDEVMITTDVLPQILEGPHELDVPVIQMEDSSEDESTLENGTGEDTEEETEEVTEEETEEDTEEETEEVTEEETKEDAEEAIEEDGSDDTGNLIQARGLLNYSSGMSTFAVSSYSDLFAYTDDGDRGGKYPTHGTNNYTAGATSEYIKNYNFADADDPESGAASIENILGGALNFDNGYHAYSVGEDEEIYLKKIVKPTDDPAKFDIQLDIIGGVKKEIHPIDVVFVIDNSTSMNSASGTAGKTRWQVLKEAFALFAGGLLDAFPGGEIRIGLVGFGGTTGSPFAEMAYFGGNQNNRFSYNKSDFIGTGAHQLISATSPTGTYTPTFMGLDAGFNLLYNESFGARAGASKYLIYLTDGAPTVAPTAPETDYVSTFNTGDNQSSRRTVRTTISTGISSTINADGDATRNFLTIRHADYRRSQNLASENPATQYAIGLTNQTSFDAVLQALGPDRTPYKAWDETALQNAVQDIANRILSQAGYIREASVFDAMSEFVTLDTTSIQKYALTYNVSGSTPSLTATNVSSIGTNVDLAYANDVVVDDGGGGAISLSNLTLGGKLDSQGNIIHRNGYRITYQVTLKEEYRDSKFYPANEPTYLADNQYSDPFGFAVPSVKAPPQTFDVKVEKEWLNDDGNGWNTRQDVTLQLEQKVGSGSWTSVAGKSVTIPNTASDEQLHYVFEDVPVYADGVKIEYRVVESSRVTGYKAPVYSPASVTVDTAETILKVTNELLKTSVSFKKAGHDGTTALPHVGFTLYKADGTTAIGVEVKSAAADGTVSFPVQLPVGTYVIKETTSLPGYQVLEAITITITDNNAVLVVNGLPNSNIVTNKLKDFKLIVLEFPQFYPHHPGFISTIINNFKKMPKI